MRLVIVLLPAICPRKDLFVGVRSPNPSLPHRYILSGLLASLCFFWGGLEAGIKHSDILRCELKMHHDASNSKVGTIRLSSRSGHWGSSP